MFGVNVKKIEDQLVIRWQFSKVEIPISNITSVTLDDTYGGSELSAVRIGAAYGASETILIRTTNQSYILFTSNEALFPKISDLVSSTVS
ncbi:SunI/YnzG family protein [Paenibacillus sp. USHLN196]|uniref:SunI/YnzG family protein n=1 Tax=Paenibacillus sp. USHLN196 TaxID=3081291 RepID=UPI00301AE6D5